MKACNLDTIFVRDLARLTDSIFEESPQYIL